MFIPLTMKYTDHFYPSITRDRLPLPQVNTIIPLMRSDTQFTSPVGIKITDATSCLPRMILSTTGPSRYRATYLIDQICIDPIVPYPLGSFSPLRPIPANIQITQSILCLQYLHFFGALFCICTLYTSTTQ